jgi:hypothetical protein
MAEEKSVGPRMGGVYASGGSSISAQNIAGGDLHIRTNTNATELERLFEPVAAVLQNVSPEVRGEAERRLESIKSEVLKGEHANSREMTRLLDGLIDLVPQTLKSLAAAFGNPLLAGVAGPATQFLLEKVLQQ